MYDRLLTVLIINTFQVNIPIFNQCSTYIHPENIRNEVEVELKHWLKMG